MSRNRANKRHGAFFSLSAGLSAWHLYNARLAAIKKAKTFGARFCVSYAVREMEAGQRNLCPSTNRAYLCGEH